MPAGAGVPAFPLSLEDLRARYGLEQRTVDALAVFGGLLAYEELVPTTVRDPQAVLDDHLADALVALEVSEVRAAGVIADLGAGAGVPGLPLAAALRSAHVVLVEGNGRKCEFMRRAADTMGLANVEVVHGRAETWHEGIGRCDVVTARALAPLDVVEEYASPLLKLGGILVAWRGKRDPKVEADGLLTAEILGLQMPEPLEVHPYPGAEHRHLHVISKVMDTPDRFPRRDGIARKRPLGRPRGSNVRSLREF